MSRLNRLVEQREAVNARIKQEQNKLRAAERETIPGARCLPVRRCWNGRNMTTVFGSRPHGELKAS